MDDFRALSGEGSVSIDLDRPIHYGESEAAPSLIGGDPRRAAVGQVQVEATPSSLRQPSHDLDEQPAGARIEAHDDVGLTSRMADIAAG